MSFHIFPIYGWSLCTYIPSFQFDTVATVSGTPAVNVPAQINSLGKLVGVSGYSEDIVYSSWV